VFDTTEYSDIGDHGGNEETTDVTAAAAAFANTDDAVGTPSNTDEAAGMPPSPDGAAGTPEYSGGEALMYTAGETSEQQDSIQIADEVIIQIITIATGKIDGISLPSAGVGDGIAGFLGMKGSARGIRIETVERNIEVDISISVEYGHRINEIAKALQDEVRGDLTEMTGLNVSRVNIHVLSINTKSVKKDAGQAQQPAAQNQAQDPVQGQ